ncbi:hypothetical protein [Pseudomonas koreensis]|uniref:hypothetical protein n=1 Tax=Pseudomonas koreensis TaxID=198620 RepID=UPI003D7FAD18
MKSRTFATPKHVKRQSVEPYKKPESDKVVERKGGNHNTLKEWTTTYDSDTVESCLAKGVWHECKRALQRALYRKPLANDASLR